MPLGSKPAVVAARLREPAWCNRVGYQVENFSLLIFPITDTKGFPAPNDYKRFSANVIARLRKIAMTKMTGKHFIIYVHNLKLTV